MGQVSAHRQPGGGEERPGQKKPQEAAGFYCHPPWMPQQPGSIQPNAFIPRPGPGPLTTCASYRQQLGFHRAWRCEGLSAQPCCKAEWPESTAGRQKPHWLAVSHAPGMGAALPGGCGGSRAKSGQLKVRAAPQEVCSPA